VAENGYIPKTSGATSSGWLLVRRDTGQADATRETKVSLPEYLKVSITRSAGERDYFTALEGVEKDKKFSVLSNNLTRGTKTYSGAARLTFSISRGLVTFGDLSISAKTYPGNPIPEGEHPIQIPDFPHPGGEGYLNRSKYAYSWFFLGTGNAVDDNSGRDRYLHTGTASAGCVTVDPNGWTALYEKLILCRSGNGKTVGTIKVSR
jgi:hypothetical protein